jgi:16S rRNA (cytosine967-C5)-methyltransferase
MSAGAWPRLKAIRILGKIEEGYPADLALQRALREWEQGDPRDKALVHEMVQGVLRHRLRIDRAMETVSNTPLAELESDVLQAVRLGLYQLFFLDRVPDYAAIKETVDPLLPGQQSFANAALREAQRRGPSLLEAPAEAAPFERAALEASIPSWLAEYLRESFSEEEALAIMRRSLETPPLTIRVNVSKTTRDALLEAVKTQGFPEAQACEFSPLGIRLGLEGNLGAPQDWFFLREGLASVQDEASQIAALLMAAQPSERLLDFCAAPGGKATLMAEQMDHRGQVIACDRTEPKLRRVRQLSRLLGLDTMVPAVPTPVEGDLWPTEGPLAGPPFDGVLVDAPCAGLGTMARRPDVKWHKTRQDLDRLAELQVSLLRRTWGRLRPGGRMVYSTCSLGPIENQRVANSFLSIMNDAELWPPTAEEFPWLKPELVSPEGYFVSTGAQAGMDGFFAARFRKKQSTI